MKFKKPKADATMSSGANRPHSKLNYELVGVTKDGDKRSWQVLTVNKLIFLFVSGLFVVAAGTWVYVKYFDSEPKVVPAPRDPDPFEGSEPDWAPVFEYKTKDQR